MSIPLPQELIDRYHLTSPEQLAAALGFQVTRATEEPRLPGVAVWSEFKPQREIILYVAALRRAAAQRGQPFARFEQWSIAHELYHALAETHAISAWRVRETAADMWADELMALGSREA